MTKGEALRDFVKERLSAAAEEIFAQFERTIAEYEEEVWRSKEKSRRKRALLESALNPRVVLLREAVNTGPVWSPGPDPNHGPDQEDQEIPETAQITDEPEEEHLQERVPESSAVFAKTEASSLLPQTEPQGEETQGEETQGEETQGEETQGEETQGEDVSAEPHFHSEADRDVERSSFTDYDEEWGAPLSSADDDDHDDQDQTGTQAEESAPESSAAVNDDDVSGTAEGSERKSHQCHVCKKKLRGSKHDLVKHMRIHTGERPYSCSVCQKKFNQMGHLNVHKRIHTRASPYSCSTCSKSFSRLVDLNTHSKTHSEERPSPRPSPSPGPGPNQEIPETSRITDEPNEESVRPEEERLQVRVPESSAVFVKTDSLLPQTEAQEETQGEEPHLHSKPDRDVERSSDTHNEEKWRLVQVQIGTSATSADPSSTADNDASGTAQGPEDKMQECPVCKKRLKGDKQKLQQHMRIHTGEKPYSCSVCNKAFSRMDYLNVHRRTHTGERRYICSICNKTFSRMDYLNAHRRTHTGEKPYRCTICDETFSHSRELNNHRRAHTGERPYNCPICQKEFTRPFKLKCHLRLHTGEKPFSCSICKKEYAQPNGLQYHMRVHSGEKPFSCPHCNRTFSAKSTLRVHVRTHTGERPYSCSICNKAFAQLSNLNVHRKKHNEDGQLSNPRPGLSRGLHQETPETSRIKDEPEEEYLQITI